MNKQNTKYEYIDSLRGIAILMVIMVHVWMENLDTMTLIPKRLDYFMQLGRASVQLFFMVSAYTLMISHNNRRDEKNKISNFFIRRITRIFPMYYLAIIFYTFINFVGFNFNNLEFSSIPLKGLIVNILMIQSFFPAWTNDYVPGGWSVSIEFTFYMLLPFLVTYISNIKKSCIFLIITIIISILAYNAISESKWNVYDFPYFNIFNQLAPFALGILAYYITKKENNVNDKAIVCLTFMLIVYIKTLYYTPAYFTTLIALFLLLIALSFKTNKIFSNKILAQIGKQSFSIYLIHFALIKVINHFLKGNNFIFVDSMSTSLINYALYYFTLLALSMIASYFTYYYIEEKGIKLGKLLITKLESK